jgi:hypothetical protein
VEEDNSLYVTHPPTAYRGLSILRLIVDISRSPDGHVAGQTQAPGKPALPFSGFLELLRAIEDALLSTEEADPAPASLNTPGQAGYKE